MVVLNVYGRIEPVCISEKLKLYISNLPCCDDDWNTELVEEMNMALSRNSLECKRFKMSPTIHIRRIHAERFPNSTLPKGASIDLLLKEIADNMVCLYFDYEYEDMPMGDWTTNCFDGRCCEEDYAEKIVNFLMFLSYDHDKRLPVYTPQWIYSSNEDNPLPHRLFWPCIPVSKCIHSLKEWGKLLDTLLTDRNDYLQLDFLVNAIHEEGKYNTYHFLRLYSLCQLLLERDKEAELDWKLPLFFDESYSKDDKLNLATFLRHIRNKIAHGDFVAYESLLEKYATEILGEEFDYDYTEYSKQNWCLLNACSKLCDALRRMIIMLLTDKSSLLKIKRAKEPGKI